MVKEKNQFSYKAVVIGTSSGGFDALKVVLKSMPKEYSIPVIIVQHMGLTNTDRYFVDFLNEICKLKVREAVEKEHIIKGNVYIAPVGYHLLVEQNKTFSLTVDEQVNYSRPSIDVLFESAAEVYRSELIGIILTGASSDGANGIKTIKEYGGLTIVQDPKTAKSNLMPKSAIEACEIDHILVLEKIAEKISGLNNKRE